MHYALKLEAEPLHSRGEREARVKETLREVHHVAKRCLRPRPQATVSLIPLCRLKVKPNFLKRVELFLMAKSLERKRHPRRQREHASIVVRSAGSGRIARGLDLDSLEGFTMPSALHSRIK